MKVVFVFWTLTITASFALRIAENGKFYAEELCTSQGGNCIKGDECPLNIPDEYLGLCPEQQSLGAECCHGISLSENRCRKLGGECISNSCNQESFRIDQATDCSSDQVCCLLL